MFGSSRGILWDFAVKTENAGEIYIIHTFFLNLSYFCCCFLDHVL